MIVAVVARRGRVAVAEPYFEPAQPLTLGRRAMAEVGEGELVVVEATSRGNGRLLAHIGSPDDIHAVMKAVALDTGVASLEPPPAVLVEPDRLEPDRLDLRTLLTFTVDPPTAKDFDDALTVDFQGSSPRILVHIADVAAYVAPGSELDLDAEDRATSVYLPGRVDPMLPSELSDGACSLSPGDDRRAVTVTLDPAGGAPVFRRTLIRSDHRLAYEQADAVLAGGESETCRADHRGAGGRRRPRTRTAMPGCRPARSTSSPPRRCSSSRGRVTDAHTDRAATAAHRMIEELMVRANEAVARYLDQGGEPTLFRVHEPPEPEAVESLVERLEALDVATPPLPELHDGPQAALYTAQLAAAIDRHARRRPASREGLTSLVLRTLRLARYDPRNLGHAGLASRAYCHFTSPIRRYPDLVCHRACCTGWGRVRGTTTVAASWPSWRCIPRRASGRPPRWSVAAPRSASHICCTTGSTTWAGTRTSTGR